MNNDASKLAFASDYMEGAHPAVLDALVRTNMESTTGYGLDPHCKAAEKAILAACECPGGEVWFLEGGTQTNRVMVDALLRPWHGVMAAKTGHVAVHEAGAIEAGGHKVLELPHANGKVAAADIRTAIESHTTDANREHMVEPGMLYISQPTEYGTLYSLAELEELSATCRAAGIPLYVDGARLAYALAAPENDVTLPDLARLADAFYIGGTKCGTLLGEAVVLPQVGAIPGLFSMIKQHGALLAKGRILGVQFEALFEDGLYLRVCSYADEAAAAIAQTLKKHGLEVPVPQQTNQVFFLATPEQLDFLAAHVDLGFMEAWPDGRSLMRLATSWSTTPQAVEGLLKVVHGMAI